MSIFKKSIAMLLALILAASSFVSCSESTVEEKETKATAEVTGGASFETEEETDPLADDLPDTNFEGAKFTILSCNFFGRDSAYLMIWDEMTGDPINDELYISKTAVEDRFNVDVCVEDVGDVYAGVNTFSSSVAGGDYAFDIHIGHDAMTMGLGRSGYALNLMDMEQFNMSKPWWPQNAVNDLMLCGKMYAASTYLTYLGLHWTRAMTMNKEMLAEHNIALPYDLVREGKWTLDKMYELIDGLSQDTNNDGKVDAVDEVIGFVAGAETWYCMQESAAVTAYVKDEKGYPTISIDLDRLDKYTNIIRELTKTNDYAVGEEPFKRGHAMFAYAQIGNAYDSYRDTDVVYGFLPAPKLDENQENYINCCTDMLWAMPKTLVGEDCDRAATIIEAFQGYNYRGVIPAYFESTMKARVADSPDDTEMLQIIADTRSIGFAFTYNLTFKNFYDGYIRFTKEMASYVASKKEAAEAELKDLIAAYESLE